MPSVHLIILNASFIPVLTSYEWRVRETFIASDKNKHNSSTGLLPRNLRCYFSVKKLSALRIMKKIDILNFITSFRKEPNAIKSLAEIEAHLGAANSPILVSMLEEMKQMRTLREVEKDGKKAYQVAAK